jgi:hypothetical protein
VTTGHGDKLSRKFEQAISALLACPTVTEAAAAVGVDESTLRAWMRDPAFQAAYAEARRQVLERTVARLLSVTGEAVEALRRNLTADRAADQIRAAALVLEHAVRGVEALDLAEQLRELRGLAEGVERGKRGAEGAGREDQAAAGGSSPDQEPVAGPAAPGPGEHPDAGGVGPGPLAGEVPPLFG